MVPQGRGIVMLVEDDELIARVTTRVIETRADVARAETGEDAVEMLDQLEWDLVVLDLELPGMDGIELVSHVLRRAPHTTMLVLSGNASFEKAVAALRAGADGYMTKPFEPDALIAKVDELVERSRLRRIAATPPVVPRPGVSSGSSAR